MLRKRLSAFEEWIDESGFNPPVSVYPELENRNCVSYARRFTCPRCGGRMIERLADCQPQAGRWPSSATWVIDSWCEDCHDYQTWEGEPYANFKRTITEGETRCESLIMLIGGLVWHNKVLPMWDRQDQRRNERAVSATYPTLRQAKSATMKEHLRLNNRQWKAAWQARHPKKRTRKKPRRVRSS